MHILYIIIAGVAALSAAVFQYGKAKGKSRKNLLFAFLRFLSVFSILLLLVNPSFKNISVYEEKPALAILTDNSSSIDFIKETQNVQAILENLQKDKRLADRFSIDHYTFGETLKNGQSPTFEEHRSDLSNALSSLREIYRGRNASAVLITDGNQTYGEDYAYASINYPMPVFPIAIGDTATYDDIRIQRLNVNKYAYFGNSFPVEVILNYDGEHSVKSDFRIQSGNRTLFRKQVNFSPEKRSEIIHANLDARTRGILTYKAEVLPLENEKNTRNNSKEFGIEVIDQKTEVLILSAMVHPDIGALQRSIASNEERRVTVGRPGTETGRLNDFQLIILYQPDASFVPVFRELQKLRKNVFIICGKNTDWNTFSRMQGDFSKHSSNLSEEVQAGYNESYSPFATEDIGFSRYPPLQVQFGELAANIPYETLLFQKIKGINTEKPLLVTSENDDRRSAVLLGEDIWRWRMQDYRENGNHEKFDRFIGKLVFYLASNKKRERLETDYESFYDGSSGVIVTAQYFDRNYVFNKDAALRIEIKKNGEGTGKTYPMLLRNNYYQADLSNLEAGEYTFTVRVEGENIQRSGQFTILEFDVEQQYWGANARKLEKLAENSEGRLFYGNDIDRLYDILLEDTRFKPVQKSKENIVPLVDWKILLFLVVLSLSAEWFLRKYNGLI